MSAHAACSPSSASMWLQCPASVTLTKDAVRPSSKYAREGTAAHAVAEMTLGGDIFLPDKINVEGDEVIVSPGMCRALNPYITHVESLRALPGAVVVLEKTLVIPGTQGMVSFNSDQFAMFKVDMTFDSPEARALRERFGVKGVPEVLFFMPGGEEVRMARVVGFVPPEPFLERMRFMLAPRRNS